MIRLAFSYKRFSSPKQASGDSLRRQTAFEAEVVKEMGLVLDDSLDLSDHGVSAFRGDNTKFGALSAFLDQVRRGRIPQGSVLLLENLDRLSRENITDAYQLFNDIVRAGVTVVTSSPREVYSRETMGTDISKPLIALVTLWRANDESVQKSKRVHAAWGQRRKRAVEKGEAFTGRCPAWLSVVDGKYAVIEDRAETVRLIYRLTAEGLGLHRVTVRLVTDRVPPFGRSGHWTETYVRKLLTWPAVYGEWQPHLWTEGKKVKHGDPVPDYFPVIVPREEFDAVQVAVRSRKRKEGRPGKGDGNLFTGIAFLASTGERLCLINSGASKGESFTYLGASSYRRGVREPQRYDRNVPYRLFEFAVLRTLTEITAADLLPPTPNATQIDLGKLRQQVASLDERYGEAERQLLDPDNATPANELNDRLNKLSEARRKAKAKLTAAETKARSQRADTLEGMKGLVELLDGAEGKERTTLRGTLKAKLRLVVSEVWVYIEVQTKQKRWCHYQLVLRSGVRKTRSVAVWHPNAGTPTPTPHRYTTEDFSTFFRTVGPQSSGNT